MSLAGGVVSRRTSAAHLRSPRDHTTPPRPRPTWRRLVNPTCGSPAAPPRVAPSPTKRLPASRIRVTVGEGRGEGEMGACWERGACLETHTVRRVPPPKWSERNPQTPLPMSPCGPPCPILGIALWVHRPGEHLLPGRAELRNPRRLSGCPCRATAHFGCEPPPSVHHKIPRLNPSPWNTAPVPKTDKRLPAIPGSRHDRPQTGMSDVGRWSSATPPTPGPHPPTTPVAPKAMPDRVEKQDQRG